ncbi:MAG: HlyD family efflux transporter periplasmic adaptor subunit [Sulfurovum sp.]|nr:HlyD family efflux transporter periplasmic adaptor subunit [Sulfurovum sp.]
MQIVKKYWMGIVLAVLVGIASVMIWKTLHPKTLPENLLQGTGRMDGDLINLNTKYPGRLETITVEDGTVVKKDMVIAILKSAEQQAQKTQIEAQIRAQKEVFEAKKVELEIAKKTIPLGLEKAKDQLTANQSQFKELLKNIEVQKRVYEQAKRDFDRSKTLYKTRAIDPHSHELAQLKMDTEHDRLEALKEKKVQITAMIELSKAGMEEAKVSQKNLQALANMLASLKEGIAALEASKSGVEAMLEEMTLRSPVDGYVVEKIANVGEVIGAGMPVATLIDPHSLYLKIFVDTLQNGKIELGDKAEIFLDADPDRPIAAKVVNIAQQAEFTPKEVSVRSDRIQRVYAVHLKPLKVDTLLKLGIPAIGVISMDGEGLPESLDALPEL